MGIKIKNLQTGEFEKFNIPALKGEKGEPGEVEPSEKVDYIGKQHSKLRDTMNANVDYIIKTAIGEFNYLDYEGQHITATNSIEGHAKSAILSGQTLVNVIRSKREANSMFTDYNLSFIDKTKTYFIKFNSSCIINQIGILADSGSWNVVNRNVTLTNGYITLKPDESLEVFGLRIRYDGQIDDGSIPTIDVICVEYQDGMEKWNIPYFEGMQSVKMPVLTTTGKNLFDGQVTENATLNGTGDLNSNVEGYCVSDFVKIKSNTQYIKTNSHLFAYYDENKKFISRIGGNAFLTPSNAKFVRMNIDTSLRDSFQLEQGAINTSYEPYKSNILSTPEDLELRGIGDVKDELNVATGEVVERIGEIVLDGSEDWVVWGGTANTENISTFQLKNAINNSNSQIPSVCDKFGTYISASILNNIVGEGVALNSTVVFIRIEKSKLTTENVNGFKQWLSQNPITVQYQLATESIKTVDLSDNVVYSYKDTTHYACSSEDGSLVPTLSVKVPTDTQLTIQEQKATTQTLLIKNMDLQQSIKEVQAMNLAFNTALYNSFNSIREEVEDIKKHVSTNENLEGSF